MSDSPARNLAKRAISACVFVPGVLAICWVGGWPLFVLCLLIAGRGTWELFHLSGQAGRRPDAIPGVALSMVPCLYVQWRGVDGALVLVLLAASLLILALGLRRGVEGYTASALLTFAGVSYIGLPGSAPLMLSSLLGDVAPLMLVAIFASIWLTDAAAYGGGRLWGRRRLVPTISPGKTVVGFGCGLVGAVIPVALLWIAPQRLPSWPVLHLLGLFLLVGVAAQLGDIVESAIKRDLGVKDAPALIPGHGGLLDRFDSYFFAFPVALLYTVFLMD